MRGDRKSILIDWPALNDLVNDEVIVCLTNRERIALAEMVNYLSWQTRWYNPPDKQTLNQWADELRAKLLQECDVPIDCEALEECLPDSTTIININATLIDVEAAVTNINSNLTVVEGDITTIQENITVINERDCGCNDYPDAPTLEEPDQLCSASIYIANRLSTLWHDVVTDAQTITFLEFIEAVIGLGGFQASLLKLLWDFVVSNSNPDLVTEGDDAFNEIVNLFYCLELERDLIDAAIDASTTITSDAKALWRGALSSVTDGKIAQWAFLGSLDDATSEACDCEDGNPCLIDFTLTNDGWSIYTGNFNHPGLYVADTGWEGDLSPAGGSGQNTVIHIAKTFTPYVAGTITLTYDLTKGQFSNPQTDTAINVQAFRNGTLVHTNSPLSYSSAVNGTGLTRSQVVNAEIDEIRLLVRAARNITNPNPLGYALITAVDIGC